jgi:repressor LexA
MTRLTEKQELVLEAIQAYQSEHGYSPTVRELADHFGQSSSAGIHKILVVLEDKGYLKKGQKGQSRSLQVIGAGSTIDDRVKPYPIVGQVEAGMPQLAYEEKEGELYLDTEWAGGDDTFLLRVHGHSMIDADINDGDILVVEKSESAHNGEIVIALLEEEATVKRFYKEKDRFRLQPENPAMQPIYINREDSTFKIIGKVRGLLRKY